MRYRELSPERLRYNLHKIDEELGRRGLTSEIIIVGGSAMGLLPTKVDVRYTSDIDYLGRLPLEDEFLATYFINNDVENIFVLPDISELELSTLSGYSNLRVHLVSWSDLAVIKFYTTREKDMIDLYTYILPNITDFQGLFARLRYHKPDYPFNINDMNLNLNSISTVFEEFFKLYRVVVAFPFETLKEFLTRYEMLESYEDLVSTRIAEVESLGFAFPEGLGYYYDGVAVDVIQKHGLEGIIGQLTRGRYVK